MNLGLFMPYPEQRVRLENISSVQGSIILCEILKTNLCGKPGPVQSISTIINFHRLSMPIDQFQSVFLLLIFETMQLHTNNPVNEFKSQTFVHTASAYR